MNYTLQLHGERAVYSVPPGLHELMNDISREVLRDQPSQVYRYIADLLDTMIKVRHYSRMAGPLVDEVIGENTELLAYVQSLGVSWEEVNQAATRIQRAFRVLKCRRDLKKKIEQAREKIDLKAKSEASVSFQEFLKTEDIDFQSSSRGSSLLADAYKDFKAKQTKLRLESQKHASTHTIETFIPKTAPSLEMKRDSKLLIYQESPLPSAASGWALSPTQKKPVARVSFDKSVMEKLVYEEEPQQSELYTKHQLFADPTTSPRWRASDSPLPEEELGLPSYYSNKKGHIPMITESGKLAKVEEEDSDIVTLYSGESEIEDKDSWSQASLPSTLSNESSQQVNEKMADELFQIIEKRDSNTSWFDKKSDRINVPVNMELYAGNKDSTFMEKNLSKGSSSRSKISKQSSKKKSKSIASSTSGPKHLRTMDTIKSAVLQKHSKT